MPDSLATLTSPAQPSRPDVWSLADKIRIGSNRSKIAFGLVWSLMEDMPTCAHKSEQHYREQFDAYIDQLYLLLNLISDEVDKTHAKAEEITAATGNRSA